MSQRFAHCLVVPLLVLLAATAAPAVELEAAQPEEVGMSSERLERLSTGLQEYVDNDQLAGAVVLVLRRGKVVYHEAFGERDQETNAKMQRDTIFRIASQTKAIVSTAVMLLQEEGELLISDPVGKYLPEFLETTVAVPREDGSFDVVDAERPITIRDLLTHTSGFAYGTGISSDRWHDAGIEGWYFADRDEPIGETIARMAKLPADAQPGEAWVYGYNADILGALVERVSGQSLDEYISERILEPLGMIDTHFYLPPAKRDRLAVVYAATQEGIARAPESGSTGQGAYVDGPRKSFSGRAE
jgi:CubicO group peptidase (beta-lactamase class C family)